MNYKGWYIYTKDVWFDHAGQSITIAAEFHRVFLRHTLRDPLPYIGRATEVEERPLTIEHTGRNIRTMLRELKAELDRIRVKSVYVIDPWRKDENS